MTAPAVTVGPDASVADAARLLRRHRIKRMPVVDPAGPLLGIVSRADLLKVFLRSDADIAQEIREQVLRGPCGWTRTRSWSTSATASPSPANWSAGP